MVQLCHGQMHMPQLRRALHSGTAHSSRSDRRRPQHICTAQAVDVERSPQQSPTETEVAPGVFEGMHGAWHAKCGRCTMPSTNVLPHLHGH